MTSDRYIRAIRLTKKILTKNMSDTEKDLIATEIPHEYHGCHTSTLVCYKNKIIYSKMFYLHGLLHIVHRTPYRDTLFNYKNLAVDIKWFFCLRSLTFDLCRLTLTFYNWTARQAHSGSLQTSNVKRWVLQTVSHQW